MIRVGPKSSGCVLVRRGEDAHKHRIEGDVRRGAEFGAMRMQAEEVNDGQEPPEV